MSRLKDRQQQIPNGLKFRIPELNWESPPFMSFDSIVVNVLSIAQANPDLFYGNNWPQTREDIAWWVDDFNARYCELMGYTSYIIGGPEASPPKSGPLSKAAALAVGAKSLSDWIFSGSDPVAPVLAESRALVCTKCPLNTPGDIGNMFERAMADTIRKSIELAKEQKLTTKYDKQLGVCSACMCPMKLKVWTPLNHIVDNMNPEAQQALDPHCWLNYEQ